jgi:hypothetical protein
MVDEPNVPLGSLPPFSRWRGPRAWGPDDRWQVTFGGGDVVLGDLVRGVEVHRAEVARRYSRRSEPVRPNDRASTVDVVKASERWTSDAIAPTPDLHPGDWDDDAFASYAAEFGPDDDDIEEYEP